MEFYHLGSETESDGSTSSFALGVADSGRWHIMVNNSKQPRVHRLSEREMLARSIGGIPLIKLVGERLSRIFETSSDVGHEREDADVD
jgi:hypothetical protein